MSDLKNKAKKIVENIKKAEKYDLTDRFDFIVSDMKDIIYTWQGNGQ